MQTSQSLFGALVKIIFLPEPFFSSLLLLLAVFNYGVVALPLIASLKHCIGNWQTIYHCTSYVVIFCNSIEDHLSWTAETKISENSADNAVWYAKLYQGLSWVETPICLLILVVKFWNLHGIDLCYSPLWDNDNIFKHSDKWCCCQ